MEPISRPRPSIDKLIARFQRADRELRLEALLDASGKLPAPPEHLASDQARETHRVTECQTPVFLWFEGDADQVRIFAEVPRESPTVRGFVSLLVGALDGASAAEIAELPADLIGLLKLDETLGMMRSQGLGAVVRRFRRAGAELR